jgi:hypothetical protein
MHASTPGIVRGRPRRRFDWGHLCISLLNLNNFLSKFEQILKQFNKLSGGLCPHSHVLGSALGIVMWFMLPNVPIPPASAPLQPHLLGMNPTFFVLTLSLPVLLPRHPPETLATHRPPYMSPEIALGPGSPQCPRTPISPAREPPLLYKSQLCIMEIRSPKYGKVQPNT